MDSSGGVQTRKTRFFLKIANNYDALVYLRMAKHFRNARADIPSHCGADVAQSACNEGSAPAVTFLKGSLKGV